MPIEQIEAPSCTAKILGKGTQPGWLCHRIRRVVALKCI